MDDKGFIQLFVEFFTNRVVIISFCAILLFSFVVVKLFEIQIVNGEKYNSQIRSSVTKFTEIDAPRGTIYDKFGKPLAINTVAYSVKIDDTVPVEDKNKSLLELIEILDANGEQIIDEMPITKEKPYRFLFDESEKREERWKLDMGFEKEEELNYNATESYNFLRDKIFDVPEGLPEDTERKLIAIRQSIALNRYNYNSVTIARDVKNETIAMIEEKKQNFPSATIDVEPIRVYPEKGLFSHIVGYIRSITDAQYEQYKQYDGYSRQSIVGQIGIEKAMELSLNGKGGKKTIEADAVGRVISSEITEPAVPGDKVFLTIDTEYQKKCAEILRNTLRDVIVTKLNGRVTNSISVKDICISMVKSNKKIVEAAYKSADPDSALFEIRESFINEVAEFDINDSEKLKAAKEAVAQCIDSNQISAKTIVLALFEMGMLTDSDEYVQSIKSGRITPLTVLREKLEANELEPSDTGADPCTGAVAVVDVKSGAVISIVTYPTYDNNELVNGFNFDYYNELLNDEQFPLNNRPLMQKKAPGSTFKMVSATAVLEEGIVTPTTLVRDYGSFTQAGKPFAKCWIYAMGGTHGLINVSKAIEVSCNYFFYDTVYQLGNASEGTTIQGITTLGRYISYFGLDNYSGIEIEESIPRPASPEYRKQIMTASNPNATEDEVRWKDGDTIRAAIGQSDHSFTPISMAKYIATLANGGTKYKVHLIDKYQDFYGSNVNKNEPVVESELDIAPENLEAIYKGMIAVTSGINGTSTSIFQSLPISVAGKTGTAQEDLNRSSHTWFVGFAPYDAPEIAVVVMLPFGESVPSPSATIARDVIGEYFDIYRDGDTSVYKSGILK